MDIFEHNESNGQTPDQPPDRKSKKNKIRIFLIIFADILLVGVGLVIFALFHHVLPQSENVSPIVLPTQSAESETVDTKETEAPDSSAEDEAASVSEATAAPTETVDLGMWGEKFADKFTPKVTFTANSYTSEDISISIEKVQTDGITYYVADIYIRNIENFLTAFANGTYGRGINASTLDMANENDAILAISGDYYGIRSDGIVIRNGELYRDAIYNDILIMNNDGSMQTFSPDEFSIEDILENGAYQGWSFGPLLLTDGLPMEKFNSNLNPANPRCAIGYYEPGHYCFVLVDGRQSGYSKGMTLKQLSQLFYDLGCTTAYNLDGGRSAAMVFMGKVVNQPAGGGRDISDIVYIAESQGES